MRPCGAPAHRHVLTVAQRQYPAGVGGGQLHIDVAEDGRDPEQVDVRAPGRERERERVVHARVGVDDQFRVHPCPHSRPGSPSAPVLSAPVLSVSVLSASAPVGVHGTVPP